MRKVIRLMFIMIFMLLCTQSVYASSLNLNPFGGNVQFGKDLYVQSGEVVNSNMTTIGGSIYVDGKVNGNVKAIGGNIYVNGVIKGSATTIGGGVSMGPSGLVVGKVNQYFKPRNNNLYNNGKNHFGNILRQVNRGTGRLGSFIVLSIVGVILFRFMPTRINNMAMSLDFNVVRSIINGYVVLFLMLIVTVIMFITIIGILAVPFIILIAFAFYVLGITSISLFIGRNISRGIGRPVSDVWCIVIGTLIYEAIRMLPIIGSLVFLFCLVPLAIGICFNSLPINSHF